MIQELATLGMAVGHLYEMSTYPANLCPIHCGGAASHSGPRTTILHSEGEDCKRFL